MPATTFNHFADLDPTNSFLFKMAMVLERITAAVKVRLLIEVTHLVLLGFYDDFCAFVDQIEQSENQSKGETEYKAICCLKVKAAERTAKLVERLAPMRHVRYRGGTLLDYLIGDRRLEEIRLFVQMVKLEQEGEQIIGRAKSEFMAAFGKHKLSKNQRTALLEKYRELLPVASAAANSGPLNRP